MPQTQQNSPIEHDVPALGVLLLASMLGVMAGAIVMPVLEVIRSDLGVTGTAAGLIITAHGLAIAVASPLVGRLIDIWGVRRPMAAGLILYGLAGGAGIVTDSFPSLIVSRLLLGIGTAFVFSGTTVALLAMHRAKQRDQVMGWRTTATTLGGLVWPLLAGALGSVTWHATFAIYLIGVPLGIATLMWLPEDARTAGARDSSGSALSLVRRCPTLLAWYGLMITTGLMLYTVAVFLPQRLAQIGVHDPLQVSLFMVGLAIAASVIGLLYARIRTRYGYSTLLRTTAACWVAAFVILGTADVPALLFVAAALFGIGNGLLLPVITVLIGDTPPPGRRGQATSLSGTAMFVGQFTSPLVFGPIMAATSITTGYLVASTLAAAILIALLVVRAEEPASTGHASRSVHDREVDLDVLEGHRAGYATAVPEGHVRDR